MEMEKKELQSDCGEKFTLQIISNLITKLKSYSVAFFVCEIIAHIWIIWCMKQFLVPLEKKMCNCSKIVCKTLSLLSCHVTIMKTKNFIPKSFAHLIIGSAPAIK